MISDEVRDYLYGVVGVVEATSYEKHSLWADYSIESDRSGFGRKKPSRLLRWDAAREGYLPKIGEIAGRPIHLSLLVDVVDGHRLLFWHVTSAVSDIEVVEQWLTDNVEAYASNHTNAMNFHNVLHQLNRAA